MPDRGGSTVVVDGEEERMTDAVATAEDDEGEEKGIGAAIDDGAPAVDPLRARPPLPPPPLLPLPPPPPWLQPFHSQSARALRQTCASRPYSRRGWSVLSCSTSTS